MEWSSYDGHHITSIPCKHSNLLLPFAVGIWCLRCLSLAHPPLVVTLCYIRGQGGSDFQKVLRFRFRLLTRGESLSLAHPPLVVTLCYITNTPCITSLHHITPALSTGNDIWSDLIMICQIAWLHLIWELLNEKHPRPVDNLQDLIVLHHNTSHYITISHVYDLQDLQDLTVSHHN